MAHTMANLVPVKQQDFLDEDLAIRGQSYVCLSFLSPEDVIVDKKVFLLNKFCGEVSRDVDELLTSLGTKYAGDKETLEMVKVLRDKYEYLGKDAVMQAQYDAYVAAHPELEDQYHREHGFQTSVRGIKVRGTYDTLQEAQNRVKQIQRFDDRFNVYIAAVGCWCPWSPNPDDIKDNVYTETQLNTLMKGYHENADQRDEMHAMRKKLFMESAGEGAGSSSAAEPESAHQPAAEPPEEPTEPSAATTESTEEPTESTEEPSTEPIEAAAA